MTVASARSSERFVQAGEYLLHCHDAGEGPAVIMLHGAEPGASAWSSFFGNIDAFAASHRVVAVDMPGFGRSDPITDTTEAPTTIRVRALRALLDELGIERAAFVGNSMGGTVAMAFAVDHPERTERLVLVGAGGILPTLTVPQPTEGHRVLLAAASDPTRESMRRVVDVMLYDPSVLPPENVEARLEAARRVPVRDDPTRSSTVPWRDQQSELHRIAATTLIVWGWEDRVNPLEIGLLLLRRIPDARLLVLQRCGHAAQIEQRDEFNRVALDFLGS